SPVQGRFTSQDPQPYDQQLPVTTNPYEYAGNMVTGTTDPSGQGWVFPAALNDPLGEYQQESSIAGFAPGLVDTSANRPGMAGGQLQTVLNPATTGYWAPVF